MKDGSPNPLLVKTMATFFTSPYRPLLWPLIDPATIDKLSEHQKKAICISLYENKITFNLDFLKSAVTPLKMEGPNAQELFQRSVAQIRLPDLIKLLNLDKSHPDLINAILGAISQKKYYLDQYLADFVETAKSNKPLIVIPLLKHPELPRLLKNSDLLYIANQNEKYAREMIRNEVLQEKLTPAELETLFIKYPNLRDLSLEILKNRRLLYSTVKILLEQKHTPIDFQVTLLKESAGKLPSKKWINLFDKLDTNIQLRILNTLCDDKIQSIIPKLYDKSGEVLITLCKRYPAFIARIMPFPKELDTNQLSLEWQTKMELMFRRYQDDKVPQHKDKIRRADLRELIQAAHQVKGKFDESKSISSKGRSFFHTLKNSSVTTTSTPDGEIKVQDKFHFLSLDKQNFVDFFYYHLQLDQKEPYLNETGFWQVCAYITTGFYKNRSPAARKTIQHQIISLLKDSKFDEMRKTLLATLDFWQRSEKTYLSQVRMEANTSGNPGLAIINIYRQTQFLKPISLVPSAPPGDLPQPSAPFVESTSDSISCPSQSLSLPTDLQASSSEVSSDQLTSAPSSYLTGSLPPFMEVSLPSPSAPPSHVDEPKPDEVYTESDECLGRPAC